MNNAGKSMSAGLRKLLVAGVVLLAIGAMLTLRLNSDKISQHFYQQLQNATAAQLSARHAELTFMHGIGLRLDTVSITHAQYQMRAKHMNVSLQLLPLLLGNTRIDLLDIHDADIIIQPESLAPTSTAISALPVQRIRLVRSRIQAAAGKTVLDNLYLEMRNIGPNSKTLWEMKAQQGKQILGGNGRLHFHAGQITDGFSKLKMEHFQLDRLQPFVPQAFMAWLQGEGNLLSGAITLDISKQQAWALFGEVELQRQPANSPQASVKQVGVTQAGVKQADIKQAEMVLKLRGKLSHPADGALVWRDSFIHIGEQAVIAIDGSCHLHQDCTTTLDAKHVPLSEWQPFIPTGLAFYEQMSGMTDLNASIQWNELQWHGNVALQLTDAVFKHGNTTIRLPALRLQSDKLAGNATLWHTHATITSPQVEGSIQLRNAQHGNGDNDLYIDTQDADSALWQPLSNMLLATLDIEPDLQAVGKIQGKLHLSQHADKQTLSLDVDATQTQVSYASWLNKPTKVVAQCKAWLDLSDSRITGIRARQCRLDMSSVEALSWSRRETSRQLSLKQLDLRLEQFNALLPKNIQGITGRLVGGGKTTWQGATSWLRNMSGQWQLEDIATEAWHVQGAVRAKAGIFNSNPLLIEGIYGKAELSGSFDPARKQGDIDITSGRLDWNHMRKLDDFWQPLSIQGRIDQSKLKLLDNSWQHIQSYYTLSHGQLRLNRLKAELADGQFTSTQLMLAPTSNGIDIQGDIRSKNIQIKKLSRLHHWLGAAISGKLQANIIVRGHIGQDNLADWQRSNGDILIYDGGWKQQQMTEKLGVSTPTLLSFAFSKLAFRFRIAKEKAAISNIEMIHLQQPWQGSATITPDLHIKGIMRNKADKITFAIDSILPELHWRAQ